MKPYYFWEEDIYAKFIAILHTNKSSFQSLHFLPGIIWQRAKKQKSFISSHLKLLWFRRSKHFKLITIICIELK